MSSCGPLHPPAFRTAFRWQGRPEAWPSWTWDPSSAPTSMAGQEHQILCRTCLRPGTSCEGIRTRTCILRRNVCGCPFQLCSSCHADGMCFQPGDLPMVLRGTQRRMWRFGIDPQSRWSSGLKILPDTRSSLPCATLHIHSTSELSSNELLFSMGVGWGPRAFEV